MLTLWGPIEVVYPVLVLIVPSVGLVLWALRSGKLLQAFPSLSWLVFVQVPFVVQASGLVPEIAMTQAFGIAIMGLFLICGDLAGLLMSRGELRTNDLPADNRTLLLILAMAFSILIIWLPVYHLTSVADIPLLDAISRGLTKQAAESREKFGKLLEIPRVYKILLNWIITVFGPLLVALLLCRIRTLAGRLIAIGGLVVWISSYAVLSTAKQPLVAFVILASAASVGFWGHRLKCVVRYTIAAGLAAFVAFSLFYCAQLATYQNNIGFRSKAYQDLISDVYTSNDLRGFSLGDINRLIDSNQEPLHVRLPHYIVYRTFLTPVEVAYHWYAYFPRVSGTWREPAELLGTIPPGLTHAANRVGRWAYAERFPDHYLDSVSAYASPDADAYSFGGLLGVVLAGLLAFGTRMAAAFADVSPFGRAVSSLLICQLGLFAMSASMQAILVAQGAGVLIVLSLVIWLSSLTGQGKAVSQSGHDDEGAVVP